MLDILIEIYGELKRNKLRTIATGFAVTSGLFLLIVLQGAGNGIINAFTEQLGQFSFDAVRVFGGQTTMPYQGIKEGRNIELENRDVEMSKNSFSDRVKNVMPMVSYTSLMVSNGENYVPSVELHGVYPEYLLANSIKIVKGRFINKIDLAEQRKNIVIGDRNEKDLFKNGEQSLGSSIKIGSVIYKVVGVFKADEMRNNNEMFMPFTTLKIIYNKGEKVDEITMNIKNLPDDSAMTKFEEDYRRASSYIHSYNPKDERALWIWNQAQDSRDMNKAMNILHNAFWILGLLTLVSGIVGVSNIMLISVKERTREFGIRRAIGARPWSIIRMVILESVIITSIFGYIGMLLGIIFCEWMDKSIGGQTMDLGVEKMQYFVNPTVDLSTCISATIVIIIAGAFAGFFPARKAVKMKTVEALNA